MKCKMALTGHSLSFLNFQPHDSASPYALSGRMSTATNADGALLSEYSISSGQPSQGIPVATHTGVNAPHEVLFPPQLMTRSSSQASTRALTQGGPA